MLLGNDFVDNFSNTSPTKTSAMQGGPSLPGSKLRPSRHPLCLPPPNRPRVGRNPSVRGGVRRRPIRRDRPQAKDKDVEVLQLVLLLHGSIHAGRRHGGGVYTR